MIRRVLGVIVRVGRVRAIVVGHVRGLMRIHISTVGRHRKIGGYVCRNRTYTVREGFCNQGNNVVLLEGIGSDGSTT